MNGAALDAPLPPDSRNLTTDSSPVYLVTCTPGAGKSTVARALTRRFTHGVHLPLDDLREWVVAGIAHPVPEWTPETSRQFALARAAAVAAARIYADDGFAVVLDDVVLPLEAKRAYLAPLASYKLRPVLLCPRLEVALARNAARRTKAFDPATLAETIRRLAPSMTADRYARSGWQVVDSSDLTVEETVDAILTASPARIAGRDGQARPVSTGE